MPLYFTIEELEEFVFGERSERHSGVQRHMRKRLQQMGFDADNKAHYQVKNPAQYSALVERMKEECDGRPIAQKLASWGDRIRKL